MHIISIPLFLYMIDFVKVMKSSIFHSSFIFKKIYKRSHLNMRDDNYYKSILYNVNSNDSFEKYNNTKKKL